ncbi:radical SAM protein [Candidatus Sumerlaeota bacterium]|nr:radical SAM protein [Candidatus Sumerlaeota bacterium]
MAGAIKKVLLINPPSGLYRRDDRCQSRVEEQTVQVIFPPIDLAYLGAVAEECGAEARIVDYPAEGSGWENFILDITRFNPQMLIFDVTTATLSRDLLACRIAKEINPDIITAGKGDYLSIYGEQVLREHREIDLVFVRESEATLRELLTHGIDENIQGIMFRGEDEQVIVTEKRPFIKDLDALPFPARHLLNNELYRSPETNNKLTVVYGNRGCPAKCIFCPAGRMSGYKLRSRSPENVVRELEECVHKFGITEFLLHGDTFTMRKSWVIELCKRIVDAGLNIRWGCNSRVDTIDEERAEWLRNAGCWVVAFGVESGSQLMLDKMKKGATVEQAKKAVNICKRAGLRTHAFYIIGLPWETAETLQQTFELARELDTDFFDINIAYPLPGTEFFEIAKRDNLLVSANALADGSYARAAVRTYELSAEELTLWRRQALMRLYLRPHYIFRTLMYAAESPRVIKNYLSYASSRIRHLIFG